jgi:ABC-type transport system involved in cytochrome bd biosynthesis fused ATPase/permease subunit
MERSRQLGNILMAVAALQMLVMLIGAMRRSYLVIAVPVVVATAVISALTFWVGWTMANTDPELARLEEQDIVPAAV